MSYLYSYSVVCLVALWALGGITALLVIARKEKKRLGGTFMSSLLSDITESPYVATTGYILTFLFSWLSVINHLFVERD